MEGIFLLLPIHEQNELKGFFQTMFSAGIIINWEKKNNQLFVCIKVANIF